jgi:hypothetical protein
LDEGIGVKPRCFFDKALVELFALRGGSQCVADAILAAPSYPSRLNSRQGSGRRSRKGCKGGYLQQVHFIFPFLLARMAFEGLTGRAIVLTSFTSIAVAALGGTSGRYSLVRRDSLIASSGTLLKDRSARVAEIGCPLP